MRVLDDHEGFRCIKLLPDGADTSPGACHRIRADPDTRTPIDAHLAMGPQGADILCNACYASIRTDLKDQLPVLYTADEIVYHLKAK